MGNSFISTQISAVEKYNIFAEAAVMIIGLLESVGPLAESYRFHNHCCTSLADLYCTWRRPRHRVSKSIIRMDLISFLYAPTAQL